MRTIAPIVLHLETIMTSSTLAQPLPRIGLADRGLLICVAASLIGGSSGMVTLRPKGGLPLRLETRRRVAAQPGGSASPV